jgi:hypothetical protein
VLVFDSASRDHGKEETARKEAAAALVRECLLPKARGYMLTFCGSATQEGCPVTARSTNHLTKRSEHRKEKVAVIDRGL